MNTFDVMGVAPLIGRGTSPSDATEGAEPVVVLGYKFWQRQFGGDPGVLGRKLRLNDKVRTVIGVMPPRFMWRGADVYLPDVFHRGQTVEGERERPSAGPAEAGCHARAGVGRPAADPGGPGSARTRTTFPSNGASACGPLARRSPAAFRMPCGSCSARWACCC